jgi:hypothetical protein
VPLFCRLAGMFTVLKNLSNLMTIAGDYAFFGYTYSWQVRRAKRVMSFCLLHCPDGA